MPYGNCVLFISTIGAFYSKLYNLKEHPNYKNLYEPREHNIDKKYNHKKEMEYIQNTSYKLLVDSGLAFAEPQEYIKIENVDNNELNELLKNGVIQYEDLKMNI